VVTRVGAAPGEVVDGASDLFTIADISRVYVEAQLYETDLGRVRLGQPATITVAAYSDEHFVGRVSAIGDVVDPHTRTIAVRCEVDNSRRLLKLDMLASVDLPTASVARVLTVPADAVQTLGGQQVVFVKTDATHFTVRPVEVGQRTASTAEIVKGLAAGENVVTANAFQVKSALLSKGLGEKEG